jgi:thioredoxin 1
VTKPIDLTEASFDKEVIKSKIPVLVDFWAPWCRPCMMTAPILDELAEEYKGKLTFTKINIDENGQVARQYGVMSIPNLIIFKNGTPATQVVGYKPKAELKHALDGAIG